MATRMSVKAGLMTLISSVEAAKTQGDVVSIVRASDQALAASQTMRDPTVVDDLRAELDWNDETRYNWIDAVVGIGILAARGGWAELGVMLPSMANQMNLPE